MSLPRTSSVRHLLMMVAWKLKVNMLKICHLFTAKLKQNRERRYVDAHVYALPLGLYH